MTQSGLAPVAPITVTIDARHAFGRPVITGTRIPTK